MKKLRLAVLLSVLCSGVWAQTDDPLKAARDAITAGQSAKALEILQPLEAEKAGDPAYDYLLGLARLDAGDPERAVFAFERVLAMQPNHAQARAEIGRAYLLLGERDAGVRELEAVRKGDIPDDARKTIENYLSAFGAGPTRLSGYLEATGGYDSNVNSAVAATHLVIPLTGLDSVLSRDGRRQEAAFLGLAGGINFAHPLSERWSVLGGASFSQRFNNNVEQFDTRTLEGNVGLRYARAADAFTLGVQGQSFDVHDARNRDALGIVGQWQHQLDQRTQVSVFGQYVQLRYPSQGLRDADRSVGGVAVAKVLEGAWAPSLFASAYAGEERELKAGVPYLGHTPLGVRFGGQLRPSSTVTWFANASYENRRYGGQDPLFLVRRKDDQWDLRLGLNYEPVRSWVVSPQVSYTRNESSVALNDYSRSMVSVTLRREF